MSLSNISLKEFKWGSTEYLESVALRDLILRKPLGRSIKDDDLEKEKQSKYHHFGAFMDNKLVGTIYSVEQIPRVVQLKQFAVSPDLQSHGIGRKLMNFTEQQLKDYGVKEILIFARQTALPFYQKIGYPIICDPFIEVGIPHRLLIKHLE
ncbi:acetyltransferase, GNAT family protein [Trichomonas vaginalis G3]|uniref:Acetyltransferase, GNAT family protein n=1 Tax=Trichomonas vaginalis (strain ATCC PRA-98 / G3) TaxID=412133 RepID=A2EGT3_TRIV3|nr:acetyltransferase (GNAT) domain-containing protein [Trichomonas vaginalis G3]EAY08171.1 acetyltransferase, GNAT family protein [Trichomonas vaginalis G3]KAI5548697.1 acetyltransferase (GNAT) domain-containing protein [Trichomonas vaginalis G3]|eukprot:XP_001320394.1 acetyltransferase, GNAT family protein [Trichomonas vaginalis G3]